MAHKRKPKKAIYPGLDIKIIDVGNGLRVAYKYVPFTRTVHCGYVFNAGSRDDGVSMGLAHFIEHMIFKGTEKRKTYHILNYLESVGGELNAYTGKEKTCIYASLTSDYVERATELLTDIAFHSVFPEKEIAKEKQVIAEEIDLYRDAPDEAIFEDFDEMVFPDHALGWPILGSKESVNAIGRDELVNFLGKHYTHGNMVYAIVGNVTEKEVMRLIDKYLRAKKLPGGTIERNAPAPLQVINRKVPIHTHQAHEITGGRAMGLRQEHYYSFMLLNNMLGGPAMNSRLNLNVREKYGLTYSINTFYSSYLDSGLWGIYYACEPGSLKQVRRLVKKELNQLKSEKLGSLRLHQMKKQLIGQYTLGYENLLSQMLGLAKDVLDFDEVLPFASHVKELESVTAEDILEVSQLVFDEQQLSNISYLPE